MMFANYRGKGIEVKLTISQGEDIRTHEFKIKGTHTNNQIKDKLKKMYEYAYQILVSA